MLVKFIAHSTIYMPGEVAELPDNLAKVLIARRAAVALGERDPACPGRRYPGATGRAAKAEQTRQAGQAEIASDEH